MVEFYNGSWGGTILYKAKDRPLNLGNLICKSLQCGSFLTHLSGTEAAGTPAPGENWPLPIRWEAQNGSCDSLQQCFQKTTTQEGGQALTVICSGKLEADHTSSGYLLPLSKDMGSPDQMFKLYEKSDGDEREAEGLSPWPLNDRTS